MSDKSILYPAGTGDALSWRVSIIMDGVDVSENVTGTISVDGEEGTARIATFVLKPTFGALDIALWVGKPVELFYVTKFQGTEATFLLFKGYVDMPTYDPLQRLVTFRCSDFMQKRIERMSRTQLIAEAGGEWSPYVFDPLGTNWQHFQERMSTQCASYDLDVNGVGHSTPWASDGLFDFTFEGRHILQDSLKVDLASSRDVINTYYMTFAFRYPRVYEFGFPMAWDIGIGEQEMVEKNIPYPTFDIVMQALDGVDWCYQHGASFQFQQSATVNGRTLPYANQDLVNNVVCQRVKRWSQPISTYSQCVMRAPQSIAATGLQEATRDFSYDMSGTGDHFSLVWDRTIEAAWPIDAHAYRYHPFTQYAAKLPASAQEVEIRTQRLPDTGEQSERYVTGGLKFKYVDCDETFIKNWLPWSNQFDKWLEVGAVNVVANVKSGFYEEEQAADMITCDGGYLKQVVTGLQANTPYTFSVYAWAGPYEGGRPIWISLADNNATGVNNDPDSPPDPVPGPDNINTVVAYLTGKPGNVLCTLTTGKRASQITVTIGWYDGEMPTEGGARQFFLERGMLVAGGKPAMYVETNGSPGNGPTYRETFDEADKVAKSIIKAEMLASHRKNYVAFTTPLFPLLERTHHVRVDTDLVMATGKVGQVLHELDTFTGSAVTHVRLILSKAMRTAVPDDPVFLPIDKPIVGTATPPRVKSKFTTMSTYVGLVPDGNGGASYINGYDYTITNDQVTPFQHAPYYGWITNAGGGTLTTNVGATIYGMWEAKFVCGTPQINAEHMGERTAAVFSEIDVPIPDDELVMIS